MVMSILRQHAFQFSLAILCAAAMYMVYRDMRKMEARLAAMDAAILAMSESEPVFEMCDIPVECAYDDILEDYDDEVAPVVEVDEVAPVVEVVEVDEVAPVVEVVEVVEADEVADPST
jgi:hypothetical protein